MIDSPLDVDKLVNSPIGSLSRNITYKEHLMSRSTVRRFVIRTAAVVALTGAVAIGPVSHAQAGGSDGHWKPGYAKAVAK